jgi:hypothetical protein
MLYSETIALCYEIHTKHRNTFCRRSVLFLNVKRGGTYSNHRPLKVWDGRTRLHSCELNVHVCGTGIVLNPSRKTFELIKFCQ